MLIPFSHGIVSGQLPIAGATGFLQVRGSSIDIAAAGTPLVVNIAHGASHYLIIIEDDLRDVWTGLGSTFPISTQWLYMDVNQLTGAITYGNTGPTPIMSGPRPIRPPIQPDQHWFDQTSNRTFVWSGMNWNERIRVFLGKVNGAASIEYIPFGTQIERAVTTRAGKIIFSDNGRPVRKSSGELFQTHSKRDCLPLKRSTQFQNFPLLHCRSLTKCVWRHMMTRRVTFLRLHVRGFLQHRLEW